MTAANVKALSDLRAEAESLSRSNCNPSEEDADEAAGRNNLD
jgi:hypothetical protein